MIFLGIDPGKSGAFAFIREDGSVLETHSFKDFRTVNYAIFMVRKMGEINAAIEKVHTMPRQGVVSAFTFGANFGGWEAMLIAHGIPYVLVTPQKWQKQILDFQITKETPKDGETTKEGASRAARNKAALKAGIVQFVKRRIPGADSRIVLKKDWDIADALCLALYAKREFNSNALP